MSLTFGDNISYQGKKPLDARMLFATKSAMKSYSENYLPALAMCQNEEDGNLYVYNVANTVDETTGKWRKFEGGGSGGGGMLPVIKTTTDTDATKVVYKSPSGVTTNAEKLSDGVFQGGVNEYGNFTVESYVGSFVVRTVVEVTAVQLYTTTIFHSYSDINVTTVIGSKIHIEGENYSADIDATSEVTTVKVCETGNYALYSIKDGVKSETKEVNVAALERTYTVSLNFIVLRIVSDPDVVVTVTKEGETIVTYTATEDVFQLYLNDMGTYEVTGSETATVIISEYKTYIAKVKAVTIVPWACDLDEVDDPEAYIELLMAAIDKHYNGEIDLRDYWNVGDELKNVPVTNVSYSTDYPEFATGYEKTNFTIIGFECNDKSDGSGKAAIVVAHRYAHQRLTPDGKWTMVTETLYGSDPEVAFYPFSKRRTWMNTLYKASLPFKDKIKEVVIKTYTYNSSTANNELVESNEYVYIPSISEYTGKDTDGSTSRVDGKMYDFFEVQSNRPGLNFDTNASLQTHTRNGIYVTWRDTIYTYFITSSGAKYETSGYSTEGALVSIFNL